MIYAPKAERKTRKELRRIPVTEQGSRSERWQGVQHGELADLLIKKMADFEFTVARETWCVNPSETILFGAVEVSPSSMEIKMPKIFGEHSNFCIGVRHSNNSRHALSFLVGATIFICGNGVATGEIVHKRRHTKSFDPETDIEEAISLFQKSSRNLGFQIQEMAARQVTFLETANLVIRAAETGLIPWRNVEHVWKEIKEPTHDEFAGKNAWGIYNCFTEKAKLLGVPGQIEFFRGLYPLFQDELGLRSSTLQSP